jgi:hypothetical protein
MTTVRVELLDCIQVNLAVLADRLHGQGAHLALGAPLRFRPGPGEAGLPTVEPGYTAQIANALPLLGLTAHDRWTRLSQQRLRETVEQHGSLYVVADAFDMPWLPYFGQKHMEHSFLVSGAGEDAEVSDAYYNETQWGAAVPGQWRLPWTDLPAIASLAIRVRPDARPPDPESTVDLDAPGDYIATYTEYPDRSYAVDRLTVETWLLLRSRRLHALYRWGAAAPAAVTDHLEGWDRLAGQAFLALRRVQRGRPEPGHVLPELGRLLAADRDVFAAEVTAHA